MSSTHPKPKAALTFAVCFSDSHISSNGHSKSILPGWFRKLAGSSQDAILLGVSSNVGGLSSVWLIQLCLLHL